MEEKIDQNVWVFKSLIDITRLLIKNKVQLAVLKYDHECDFLSNLEYCQHFLSLPVLYYYDIISYFIYKW